MYQYREASASNLCALQEKYGFTNLPRQNEKSDYLCHFFIVQPLQLSVLLKTYQEFILNSVINHSSLEGIFYNFFKQSNPIIDKQIQ